MFHGLQYLVHEVTRSFLAWSESNVSFVTPNPSIIDPGTFIPS